MLSEFKNILLVSGSGRNCGKTTVACDIIKQKKKNGIVYGLKITPHFHSTEKEQLIVDSGVGYKIFRETDSYSGKDSSRMLGAGAKAVYFIQCTDVNLPEIKEQLNHIIPKGFPIVCESGSFANVYQPGLHILVIGANVDESKRSYKSNLKKAEVIITSEEFTQSNMSGNLSFKDNHWTLLRNNHN